MFGNRVLVALGPEDDVWLVTMDAASSALELKDAVGAPSSKESEPTATPARELAMRFAALAGLLVVGCTWGGTSQVENNRGFVVESDGRYAFYGGRGVGASLSRGEMIDDLTYPSPFMRLRVPSQFVEEALARPARVLTASFEVIDTSIEATVHTPALESSESSTNLYFHPGDPWLSGYAQVAVGTDDVTVGLIEVIKWSRDVSGSMPNLFSQAIYTTGLLPDDNKPMLKYADDLSSQPLPDNWK